MQESEVNALLDLLVDLESNKACDYIYEHDQEFCDINCESPYPEEDCYRWYAHLKAEENND